MSLTLTEANPDWMNYFHSYDSLSPEYRIPLQYSAQDFVLFLEHFCGLNLADFHIEIAYDLSDPNVAYLLIEIPRGHGKSTLTELFVAWWMIYHPKDLVMVFSYKASQAKDRSIGIQSVFKDIEIFEHLAYPKMGTHDFILRNGARCVLSGIMGESLGAKHKKLRPSLIICDDVIPADTEGTVKDSKVLHRYDNVITPLGHNKTKYVIVGTPWRAQDLLGKKKKTALYKVLRYEALLGKGVDSLYLEETPVLWNDPVYGYPLAALQKRYESFDNDPLTFSRQYLCRIINEGTALYPDSMVDAAKNFELSFMYERPFKVKKDGSLDLKIMFDGVVAGVDIAHAQEGSYFVIKVWGINKQRRYQLLWIERHRGLHYDQQKALIKHLHARFHFDLVVIEDNAYQVVYAEDVEGHTDIPIVQHTTGGQKWDELIGLPKVRTHLGNHRIIYPCYPDQTFTGAIFEDYIDEKGFKRVRVLGLGGTPLLRSLEATFDEMRGWQRIDDKWQTTAEHTDTVMAQWFGILACEKFGATLRLVGATPTAARRMEQYKGTGTTQIQ